MSSDTTESTPAYKSYPQRFYVLAVFTFLNFNQNLISLTFPPIARSAKMYYNISEATIDLFYNWGSMIPIPCLPLAYLLLNKRYGLRHCVILTGIGEFAAAVVRIVPIVITSPSSPHFTTISLPFLHFGQILNAACGPFVLVPASQLSCLWFPPHERTRATTAIIVSHTLGSSVSFVISPYIASSPECIPHLLYLHLALTFTVCVLALLHFPLQPPSAPSAAAELLMLRPSTGQNSGSVKKFIKNIGKCLTTPSFLLIAIPAGLIRGTIGMWTSLFNLMLEPEHFTQQQAGWFSFGASIAGIIGGFCLSIIADRPRFQHSLKVFIVTSYIGCLLAIIWFELSVPTYFYEKPILPSTVVTIGLSTALIGLLYNSPFPLIYEAIAEIMYPLPESLSASVLVEWTSIIAVVFLFIAPNRSKLLSLIVLITVVVSILLIMFAPFSYKRRDEDERKRLEKEEEQIKSEDDINSQIHGINNAQQQYGTFT